jgi:hypothetical protein
MDSFGDCTRLLCHELTEAVQASQCRLTAEMLGGPMVAVGHACPPAGIVGANAGAAPADDAPLINGRSACGITGADRRTTGKQGYGLRPPSVVGQRTQLRVGNSYLIATDAVRQAAATARPN